jgi:hypothetical protein
MAPTLDGHGVLGRLLRRVALEAEIIDPRFQLLEYDVGSYRRLLCV